MIYKNNAFRLSAFVFTMAVAFACFKKSSVQSISELDYAKFPLANLSEYGIYDGEMSQLVPTKDLLAYAPAMPLFTDYAFKKRFVYIPADSAASFDLNKPDAAFAFPEHSILVKNFYYPADFNKPDAEKQIIETRLLVKKGGKWEAYPYVWNKEQTEAVYKSIGGKVPVTFKNEAGESHSIDYTMPNKNQCKSCHNQGDTFSPIGLKVKQLNNDYAYAEGSENQLAHWMKLGKLKGEGDLTLVKNMVSMTDTKASLSDKARSYLDSNCGHCHNPNGPAGSSGLRLTVEENDPFHWGVYKSPVAAGMGAGNLKYDIFPGKGKESIITYRMNSTHPGVMMPEIGRVSIHKEGVALLTAWIDELEPKK